MNTFQHYKIWSLTLGLLILLVPFQNCSSQWMVEDQEALTTHNGTSACDTELHLLFNENIYPFLKHNCSSCHNEGGQGIGHFAHHRTETAWSHFNSMGIQAIFRNALNNNHRPPNTGDRHSAILTSIQERWSVAYQEKQACESEKLGEQNPLALPFLSLSKSIQTLSTTEWTTFSWNLYSESEQESQNRLISAELRIELRYLSKNETTLGYEFRNPQIKLNSKDSIKIKSLYFFLNKTKATDLTMYSQINKIISPDDKSNSNGWIGLIETNANGFFITDTNSSDTLGIEVTLDLNPKENSDNNEGNNPNNPPNNGTPNETPAPSTVTLGNLLGDNPSLNVFRTSCVGCHNQNNPSGTLDITNPTEARASANAILSRMRNPDRPMPTQGLLPPDRVRLVEIWISSGLQ
jgi:hypothetical protein